MTAQERRESVRNRLAIPKEGKLPCVFDSDTFNEIDDQYALAYLMAMPERFDVQALYSEPFITRDVYDTATGQELSYRENFNMLKHMHMEKEGKFVYRGSERYMDVNNLEKSEAALDLVERAKKFSPESPLYVIATGCITNIGNALALAPEIADNLVICWLGGHSITFERNDEFNLKQDVPAARTVFESGAAVIHVACVGCTSHLISNIWEMEHYMAGKNETCDYLLMLTRDYLAGKRGLERYHYAQGKVLWDVGAVAYLANPDWFETHLYEKAPTLKDDYSWVMDAGDYPMLELCYPKRDAILGDMFKKFAKLM